MRCSDKYCTWAPPREKSSTAVFARVTEEKSGDRISSTKESWLSSSATIRMRVKVAVPGCDTQRLSRMGRSIRTPAGDPQEDPIAPQRRVERGELAVGGGHGLGGQQSLDLGHAGARGISQGREHDPPRGERFVQPRRSDAPVHVDDPARALPDPGPSPREARPAAPRRGPGPRWPVPIRPAAAAGPHPCSATPRNGWRAAAWPRTSPRLLPVGPSATPDRRRPPRARRPGRSPDGVLGRCGRLAHPTLPSISSSISRFSSTAYSSGSSLAIGR